MPVPDALQCQPAADSLSDRAPRIPGVVEVKTGTGGGVRIAERDPNPTAEALAIQLALVGGDAREVLTACRRTLPLLQPQGLMWRSAPCAGL